MSFIDAQLLPDERIVYRGRRHRWGYALPILLAVAALVLLALATDDRVGVAAGVLAVGAAAAAAWVYAQTASAEFAVTNRRVLIKVGWVGRRTLETLLGKIEAIEVGQTLPARVLRYGTITVIGTGGTRETFAGIARPLEFRKQVQAQIMADEDRRASVAMASASAAHTSLPHEQRDQRDEIECPYCAERILARAKVCRFCGRAVGADS